MAKTKKKVGHSKTGNNRKFQEKVTLSPNSSNNIFHSKRKKNAKCTVSQLEDYKLRQMIHGSNGEREIIEMEADGNCLFRSISHQLYRDFGQRHDLVRQEICKYLEDNKEDFSIFLLLHEEEEDVMDFESYVNEMRKDGTWGGDVEIVCAARVYKRNVTIFSASGIYNISKGDDKTPSGPDILLSYHDNSHYNSVHDESKGFTPISNSGLNDQNQSEIITKQTGQHVHSIGVHGKENSSINDAFHHEKKIRKNDICPCGSNLRFKKCCLATYKSKMRREKFRMENQVDHDEKSRAYETALQENIESLQVLNI
jgi:hypothetical protein